MRPPERPRRSRSRAGRRRRAVSSRTRSCAPRGCRRRRSSAGCGAGGSTPFTAGCTPSGTRRSGARAAAGPRCSRSRDGHLSHGSAAAAWGIATAPAVIHVTVRGRAGLRSRDGIRVHRPRALPDDEVTALRGLPITTPARTLLDLAATARSAAIAVAVDRAEQLRLIDFAELHSLLDRYPGRAGTPSLKAVLAVVHRPGRRPQPPGAARARPVRAAAAAGTARQRRHRRQRPRLRVAAAAARRRGGLVRLAPLAGGAERRPRARRGADARRLARPALHLTRSSRARRAWVARSLATALGAA